MNLHGIIEFWQELLSGPNVRYLPLLGLGALVLVLVLLSTAEGNFKLSGIKSQTVRLDSLDRRPQGTEITALDNALLSLEELVDFRAETSGKHLKIDALCKGMVKEAELRRRAECLFPAYEIGLVLREAEESDRCLYPGKRHLIPGECGD